jgi:hypothetical protein
MAALIPVKNATGWHPGRRPVNRFRDICRIISQVNISSSHIQRRIIISITRQSAKTGITIKRVPSPGVGNDPDISFTAQVINPW